MSDNLEKFYKFADENMFRHTAQEEFAWNVWQAAIESVVVDIESLPSASYTDDDVVYRSHVEDALEKVGIKCK